MIVDTQEPTVVKNFFEKRGGVVEKLPVGDIVDREKGVCIERKTIFDFIESIKSGHLQKQLLQMKQNFPYNYLLISGSYDSYVSETLLAGRNASWTSEHHLGALASCAVRYGVSVLTLENDAQLCRIAHKIIAKTNDGKSPSIRDTELLRNKITEEDIFIRMLSSFPNVGIKRAEKILKNQEIKDLLENIYSKITNKEY